MLAVLEDLRRSGRMPREIRRSVLKSDRDPKLGFVMGWVRDFSGNRKVSKMARQHHDLYRMLCKYAQYHFPRFYFESVQINYGPSSLHVDQYNCGPSMIVALGNFTGGQLWQWPGDVFDIHSPKEVDGSLPHISLPYRGKRWSIVYFAGRVQLPKPAPEDISFLHSLGQPDLKPLGACQDIRRDLLPAAAEKLKQRGLSSAYIGDFLNTSIKSRYTQPGPSEDK